MKARRLSMIYNVGLCALLNVAILGPRPPGRMRALNTNHPPQLVTLDNINSLFVQSQSHR